MPEFSMTLTTKQQIALEKQLRGYGTSYMSDEFNVEFVKSFIFDAEAIRFYNSMSKTSFVGPFGEDV